MITSVDLEQKRHGFDDGGSGPLVNSEYDYDGLGRLVGARDYDPGTSGLVETRGYGFDAATNRTSLAVAPAGLSPVTTTYQVTCDGSDRLVSIDSGLRSPMT